MGEGEPEGPELTVLMPCLNEAATLAACIAEARHFLAASGVSGEVVVADNGSTDGSREIARAAGARVVEVPVRGYGAALRAGIAASRGRYVIMGDADLSYDFAHLEGFLAALRGGADLVMGNRFRGGIAPGAMPFLHRWLGNPVLSFLGRLFFRAPCGDFHCGLRGFARERILGLGLCADGMEFASEMVARAAIEGLRIAEVPTVLRKDGRGRRPHLRTWRDGWRHLRFLLIHSPRWLFLYPGLGAMALGLLGVAALLPGRLRLSADLSLDVHSFLAACALVQFGLQGVVFALLSGRCARLHGLQPVLPDQGARLGARLDRIGLDRLVQAASLLAGAGLLGLLWSLRAWGAVGFGELAGAPVLRVMILSVTALSSAGELAMSAFLLGILETPRKEGRMEGSMEGR